MTEKRSGTKRPITLRRVLTTAAVLLLFALVFTVPAMADTIKVTTQAELENAIATASDQRTIELSGIEYDFPTISMQNKDLVFIGNTGTIIDMEGVNTDQNTKGSTLTFNNVVFKFSSVDHPYYGFAHTVKVIYKNCIFSGLQTLYAPDVEFTNCIFDGNQGKDIYYVKTYGSKNVEFTDCTFNTGGKAIYVYNEATDANFVANITLNNCIFNDDSSIKEDDGSDLIKAAVETGINGAGNTATSNKFYLTFNNCTTNGFEANNSGSPLWGNKHSMDSAHLFVVEVNTESIATNNDYNSQSLNYIGKALFNDKYGDANFVHTNDEWYVKVSDGHYNPISAPKDVGEYRLKAIATANNGYSTFAIKDVTIGKTTITVTPATNLFKEHGTTDPYLTPTYTGNFEDPSFKGELAREEGEDVDEYLITRGNLELKDSDDGSFKADNYHLEFNDLTDVYFEIIPAILPGNDVPQTHSLTSGKVSSQDKSTLDNKMDARFTDRYFVDVSLTDASTSTKDSTTEITFIVPYASLGLSDKTEAEEKEFVVLHLKAGETEPESIPAVPGETGLEIGKTTTSPFAIGYCVKQTTQQTPVTPQPPSPQTPPTPTGDSSTPKGSSVWLQEPLTPTPTETVTPTETPDVVPTDIPSTQPTQTETQSPGFGVLAVLAGLGTVAVLRRK